MERNPYSPPVATVDEPAQKGLTARPRQVLLAVELIWVSAAVGAIASLLHWTPIPAEMTPALWVVGMLIGCAILAWFTRKLLIGRNWARITLLVLTVLGVVLFLVMPRPRSTPPMSLVVEFIRDALAVYAAWLLCTEPSRRWFNHA